MPKAILLSYTGLADPSREAEFATWYDEVHIPEVCTTPGFVSGRRFLSSETQRPALVGPLPRYLSMYELDTADIAGAFTLLEARVKAGEVSAPPEGLLTPHTTYEACVRSVWCSTPSGDLQHSSIARHGNVLSSTAATLQGSFDRFAQPCGVSR
jgi:hypothetical protein